MLIKYFHIPQMNPMNWLLLFLLFNSVMGVTAVKLHYLFKEAVINRSVESEQTIVSKMNLNI